ncbi:hypothetical protein C7212DRAFT_181748, partial [Tuber magnatum]
EREHRIPVIIELGVLATALETSGVDAETLIGSRDGPPVLHLPDSSLECLHGQHRILAANRYLGSDSRWWVVDRYDKGNGLDSSERLQQYFHEGYPNSKSMSDGEILWRIRLYNRSGQRDLEQNMWCYVSLSKRKDLRQLLANGALRKAFDNLLHWPGLWPSMRLGTLHRLLTMRCDEEAVRYLQHIRNIWTRICMDRANVVVGADCKTVEMLQLRAPCASSADWKYINQEMDSKLLFPTITDINDRKVVRESIHQMRQIPSLFTFFADLKYLETYAKAFRSIIGSPQGTIHECMSHLYTSDGLTYSHLLVELQDGTFRECTRNAADGREFGYQQLWLYLMRHFPVMVAATPRKENGKTKPEIKEPDPRIWHGFATLARHLGFDSDAIAALHETDPDEKAAREFLCGSRPPRQYSIKPGELQNGICQISRILKSMSTRGQMPGQGPALVTSDCSGEVLSTRCGRPFQRSHEYDRDYMYIDLLYCAEPESKGITSLYSRREIFFAFLGRRVLQRAGTKRRPNDMLGTPESRRPAPAERSLSVGEIVECP